MGRQRHSLLIVNDHFSFIPDHFIGAIPPIINISNPFLIIGILKTLALTTPNKNNARRDTAIDNIESLSDGPEKRELQQKMDEQIREDTQKLREQEKREQYIEEFFHSL